MLHPNIVHVFDLVRDDGGQLLLVLEYVDGIHLGTLIESGPLPVSVIVFLATEMLCGLGYAHHLPADGSRVLGIVHRDLSPDNILLSWDGAVKIADFGIAKRRDATEVSATHYVRGKPGYMSPEQRLGQALDGRSDLYSVGVMLGSCSRMSGRSLTARPARTGSIAGCLDPACSGRCRATSRPW